MDAHRPRRFEEDAGDLLYRYEDAAYRHRQQNADRRQARRRVDGDGRRGGRGLRYRETPRCRGFGRFGQRRDVAADARGLGGRGDDGPHGRRAGHGHGGRPRRRNPYPRARCGVVFVGRRAALYRRRISRGEHQRHLLVGNPVDRHSEGRLLDGHLRFARRQRRRADHHQERRERQGERKLQCILGFQGHRPQEPGAGAQPFGVRQVAV